MVELQQLFNIEYGNSLDLNKLKQIKNGVNFVSRTAKNNGVSAVVENIEEIKKMPKNSITVSLGGSVLEAFLQPDDYYTGYHIFCLTEKQKMTTAQKLFYCQCIRSNKYKYSYGRQANRTLKYLQVPSMSEIPSWVDEIDLEKFDGAEKPKKSSPKLSPPNISNLISINELFEVKNGIAATGLKEYKHRIKDSVAFIRPASTHLRTLRSFIKKDSLVNQHIYPKGSLFVSTNGEGSHSYSYVSTEEFVPNSDVSVLIPNRPMSIEEKLYMAKCITANRYLFSYGRKPKGNRLKNIKVPDLSNPNEQKSLKLFIQSLKYSSNIK